MDLAISLTNLHFQLFFLIYLDLHKSLLKLYLYSSFFLICDFFLKTFFDLNVAHTYLMQSWHYIYNLQTLVITKDKKVRLCGRKLEQFPKFWHLK
jgi:hypothetical protein